MASEIIEFEEPSVFPPIGDPNTETRARLLGKTDDLLTDIDQLLESSERPVQRSTQERTAPRRKPRTSRAVGRRATTTIVESDLILF